MRDAAKPGDRVFTPQTWASWFEWAAPDAGYFLDSRFELFPSPVWDDYDAIIAGGDGAQAALGRWGVNVDGGRCRSHDAARAVDDGLPRRGWRRPHARDAMRWAGVGFDRAFLGSV